MFSLGVLLQLLVRCLLLCGHKVELFDTADRPLVSDT